MRAKVIAIANQKGGVGKTTTTVNLGVGLVNTGKKVLLIDADPQGNLTQALGYPKPDDMQETLSDVLIKIIDEDDIPDGYGILHHIEDVDFLPGNIELSALEVSLVNVMSRETILKRYISKIIDKYDYILIDCMPSLGMIPINAFTTADSVLIPVQAAYLPVKGLEQLMKTIMQVKKNLNPQLAIEGILPTMIDKRTNYAKEIEGLIREIYGGNLTVFENAIPCSVRVAEQTAAGVSIYKHDSRGKAAEAYMRFTEEVLKNGR